MSEGDGIQQMKVSGKSQIQAYDNQTGEVLVLCRRCKEVKRVKATRKQIADWAGGALIQSAMRHLNADDRELMISGTCGPCFDAQWGRGA
jgi:hypothetical protein